MNKEVTAMTILATIEKDVNDGTFDKALYVRDIACLKGRLEELNVLKTTLGQLKSHLPQYSDDVDYLQSKIQEMESDVDVMVSKEVDNSIRFSDNFDSLLNMIQDRDSNPVTQEIKEKRRLDRDKRKKEIEKVARKREKDAMPIEETVIKGVLLQIVLNLVEQQWVTEADFDKLPEKLGLNSLSEKIYLMTEVGGLIRLMPEDMFANEDTKQNMLVAAQDSLDTWIEMEADEEMSVLTDVDEEVDIVGEMTVDLGLPSLK